MMSPRRKRFWMRETCEKTADYRGSGLVRDRCRKRH